jgi:hypothetical protein
MTAAVDGWASDVLRHFEQDVQLFEEQTAAAAADADVDADLVLIAGQQQQQHAGGGAEHDLASAYSSAAAAAAAVGASAASTAAMQAGLPAGSEETTAAAAVPAAGSAASAAADDDGVVPDGQLVAETLVGAFELLEGAPSDAVGQVLAPNKPTQPPLSLQELQGEWLDAQGVLVDEAGLRQRVFAAGGLLVLARQACCMSVYQRAQHHNMSPAACCHCIAPQLALSSVQVHICICSTPPTPHPRPQPTTALCTPCLHC